ncbi:MAG: hypothetical protein ACU0B9_19490 [Limimaricola soesokkakensis]|uniref:hypothetical protein n=1 Tax=Limimaricola soesokkakensis TaxID=1343159 RepID=UPI0040582455
MAPDDQGEPDGIFSPTAGSLTCIRTCEATCLSAPVDGCMGAAIFSGKPHFDGGIFRDMVFKLLLGDGTTAAKRSRVLLKERKNDFEPVGYAV